MNRFNAETFAQSNICSLAPYQPGMSIETVSKKYDLPLEGIAKLASNENPLGMSKQAKSAANKALEASNRYPDSQALVSALANVHGVTKDHIVLGNGSNDVLDLVARVFLGPGTSAVSSAYAFSIFPIASHTVGAKNIIVPAKDFGHDLSAMISAITPNTRVVWLANPNNPTGTFIPHDELKTALQTIPKEVIVVLDQAYYEYLPPKLRTDTVSWLETFPNLIITRTFSKIHGLAGLRIGYGLGHPSTIELLNRTRQPFNTNSVALAAAVAALQAIDFTEASYQHNQRGLQRLTTLCKELDIAYIPSFGNFVTIQHPKADELHQHLLTKGVIVRPLSGQDLSEHLRVSVGTDKELDQFEHALRMFTNQRAH